MRRYYTQMRLRYSDAVVDKAGLAAEISAELGIPVFEPSRGGTITRPFLEAVALALGVEAEGRTKVRLTRELVESVGQLWDSTCSSDETASGGGGNITAVALSRLLKGIRSGEARLSEEPEARSAAWGDYYFEVADWLEVEGHLETESLDGERWRLFSSVAQRRGQSGFRERLLAAYGGRCAVSDCDVSHVLEGAHLVPHLGSRTNSTFNGLLLRSDLHVLFDLGLLGIDPNVRRVVLAQELRQSSFAELHGRRLREPVEPADRPTESVLLWRAENVGPRPD